MTRAVLPVVTLASIDPVARGSAVAGLLCDVPGALVVQYDVDRADTGHEATLRRLVLSGPGVLERADVTLEHGCLSCAIREDVLPTLQRLAGGGADPLAPAAPLLLLALPVAAEPLPVVRAVQGATAGRPGGIRTAAVVTAVDATTLEPDLLGDDTLEERGLRLFAGDDRAVGEALAHQLEVSDVLAATARLDPRSARLLAHLAVPPWRITPAPLADLHPLRLAQYPRPCHDPRGDLLQARPAGVADGDGVWTLDLRSARPLHPGRLLQRLEALGAGRLRARGYLRLASRPHTAVAWDGAGGQLSIGSLGPWPRRAPAATRIVVTGTEPEERARIAAAFEGLALTDEEHARGAEWWARHGDDLNPWLGDLADCA